MRISFHGAAQTVTGSQHLVEVNGKRILLDCGLFQGRRADARKRNRNFPFDPTSIDAMVLSHAHIDHSGNIPNLCKQGFDGNIVATPATRDLCAAMLRDSGHIQERDAEYVNRKRDKGEPPVEPIYTEVDAINSLKHFLTIHYERTYQLMPGVTVTFYDAGHMLGSAIVALDIEDEDEKRDIRLVFSGDLGRPTMPLLRSLTKLDEADVLIMESTYGGRHHPPIAESEADLKKVINETCKRGGKVIVPAFAVGRTQQLVYYLNRLYHGEEIPTDLPVFVDSPLAVNVTDIFRLHPDAYNDDTLNYLTNEDPDGDIFGFPRLKYIRHVEDSKALNDLKEPAVIISASGMAEFGRIVHHLKNNIEDSRTTVMIVGWQAPHTLGRRLVEKKEIVKIFGVEYKNRAHVSVNNAFSGHGDHGDLLDWVDSFKTRKPKAIYLVHGEEEASGKLREDLQKKLGYKNVHAPALHESVNV